MGLICISYAPVQVQYVSYIVITKSKVKLKMQVLLKILYKYTGVQLTSMPPNKPVDLMFFLLPENTPVFHQVYRGNLAHARLLALRIHSVYT